MSLTPNPEYDKAGYCANCHEPIAEFDGSQNVTKLFGTARMAYFDLNDGSQMGVMLCEKCDQSLEPKDAPAIMESVYKGWCFEIEHYLKDKWDAKRKADYKKAAEEKFVVGRKIQVWSQEMVEAAVGKDKMGGVRFRELLKESEAKEKAKD